MIAPWYTAFGARQWLGRLFCVRNLLLPGAVVLVLAGELYFGWAESAIGFYLAATNSDRPESGTVWQWGHKTLQARQKLETLVPRPVFTEDTNDDGHGLARIFRQAAAGKAVMLPARRFVAFYLRLPPQLADEIAPAFDLLRLQACEHWVRTYIEGDETHVALYHLDANNQVLAKVSIGPDLMQYILRGRAMVPGTLESMRDFRGHIFAAADFFKALAMLPDKVRRKVIARPDALLAFGTQIVRAGISDEAAADKITIGFEIELAGQPQVMLLQADRDAVERLRPILARSGSGYKDKFSVQ